MMMVYSRRLKALQDRVAQIYYTHGLFCASHPLSIIFCVICMALLACYPLTNLPLPGNAPIEVNTPIQDYQVPVLQPLNDRGKDDVIKQKWYLTQPVAYVQQIVVKATVSPWESQDLLVTDALRGPLSKAFEILEAMNTFKYTDGQKDISLADVCLRVGELVTHKKLRGILPEYNCLMVSPTNFWHGDFKQFMEDSKEVQTIKAMYGQPLATSPSLQDLLFGVPWRKTGMSGYFLRNRRRTITYAFTILYKTFSERFSEGLLEKLEGLFPEISDTVNNTQIQYIVHIHYKDINYFVEYTPLLVIYFVLLLYIYFSVCKIAMVKSKWGLAISAVATLISSLLMSVSICTLFGLRPTLNGGEIFPYLVMIIGLENVLILTKSVVSTPVHLDVKYRVAQGLSKEGWSITKNLVAELSIILIGFFTFVPAIQEFCLFAVVGLLSDFFLQIVFFATVLSVDIRRMELSDLHKQSIQQEMSSEELPFPAIEPLIRCPVMTRIAPPSPDPPVTGRLQRSKSAPGLDTISLSGTPPSPEMDETFFPSPAILPRRLRFLYFWARTRFFQRAIMVCTVIWIGLIMYKTGLVEKLAAASESLTVQPIPGPANNLESVLKGAGPTGAESGSTGLGGAGPGGGHWSHDSESLQSHPREEEQSTEHSDLELWRLLSFKHWKTLLRYYNISLSGRHISILPSIHLSINISPEEVVKVRPPQVIGKSTAHDITPTQGKNNERQDTGVGNKTEELSPRVSEPTSPRLKLLYPQGIAEFSITVILAILSLLLFIYFVVVLYKCCCSRNYDKWRSSWSKRPKRVKGKYFKQIKDSLPLILRGHSLDLECLSSDGSLIASCCLGGQIRVWDSNSGECLTRIERQGVTPPMKRKPCVGRNVEDSDADLYAEFHGEDSTPWMLQASKTRTGSLQGDYGINMPWAAGDNHLSFTGSDFSLSYSPDEGKESGHHVARRRLQAASESEVSDRSEDEARNRSWSTGSTISSAFDPSLGYDGYKEECQIPAVWCLVCQNNLVVCGCGNGRIEFWDALTGVLKYLYDDCKEGVTCLCVNGNRVTAARLNGEIDFLELETFKNPAKSHVQQVTTLHNRGHVRQTNESFPSPKHWEEIIHYNLIERTPAHQQPINSLQSVGGRVVSASLDHTLKVFRVEDCSCLYTLHGHVGSVTALHLDKSPPYAAASGSVDGTIRLWDLVTGACVHKMRGHVGVVTLLTATSQVVISCDQDDILCIWERSHGQLVHTIHNDLYGFTSLAMLFPNILVTGGQGCVCLWDVNKGEMVRKVSVGSPCRPYSVNFLQVIGNTTISCDYGNEIHVIQFPTVLEKTVN